MRLLELSRSFVSVNLVFAKLSPSFRELALNFCAGTTQFKKPSTRVSTAVILFMDIKGLYQLGDC